MLVLSVRHVRNWISAAPVLGFLAVACSGAGIPSGDINQGGDGGTAPSGNGGSAPGGNGGSAPGGNGGSAPGGNGGTSAGGAGSGGTAGAAGSNAGGSNAGGSGGSGELTDPSFDYEPVGIGDPWFFSSPADVETFVVEYDNATGDKSWNAAGEMHVAVNFTDAGSKAFIHFSAPWDSVENASDPMNLSGRVLRARVRVASSTVSAGAQGYSQSTEGWTWVSGDWNDFTTLDTWKDVELDLDTAADPSDVLRFGLQLYSNGPGSAELIIDDLRLEPKDTTPVEVDGGVPNEGDAGAGAPSDGDAGGLPSDGDAGVLTDAGSGLGYTPVGLGDPWFFDTESEFSAFTPTPGYGSNATLGTVSWSSGEVHIPMTFPGAGDTVEVQLTTPWDGSANVADLSGRVLRARVRFAGATAAGGIQGFSQSGGWTWNSDGWVNLADLGSFADVSYDFSAHASNASNVQRFGLQVYASAAGAAELIIDSIRLEPAQ